jgi:hypothetical protein
MKRFFKFAAIAAGIAVLLAVGGTYGASYYYTSQYGQGCASCHEMATCVSVVHSAPHRTVGCMECHEASLATKLRHMRIHIFGTIPENIRLRDVDVPAIAENCKTCHQHEYASWHAGPHSVTYSQVFADPVHNSKRMLMDDCLRCHGMYFSGSIRDLVKPLNTKGPWRIIRSGFADQAAMPCMACHQIHREGTQETKAASRISVAGAAVPESLAFYDRRETLHFAAATLSIPQLHDGARAGDHQPGPAPGSMLPVPCAARPGNRFRCRSQRLGSAGGIGRRSHSDGRARGDKLRLLPRWA